MRSLARWLFVVVAVLSVLLVIARLAAPEIIRARLNARLEAMPNYTGHIDDVDIELLQNRFVLSQMRVELKDKPAGQPPLFTAPQILVGAKQFLPSKGELRADLTVVDATTTFVSPDDSGQQEQLGFGPNWVDVVEDMVPLPIGTVTLQNNTIKMFVAAENEAGRLPIELTKTNGELRRSKDASRVTLDLKGKLQGSSALVLNVSSDAKSPKQDTEASLSIERTPISPFNPVLRRWGNLDVEQGEYAVELNAKIRNKQVSGELTPTLTNMDILSFSDDAPLNWLFEGFLGLAATLTGEGPENRVTLTVPISGSVSETSLNSRSAMLGQLKELLPNLGDWQLLGGSDEQPKEDTEEPTTTEQALNTDSADASSSASEPTEDAQSSPGQSDQPNNDDFDFTVNPRRR